MSVIQSLSVIALRQLVVAAGNAVGVGGAGEAVADALGKHFTDHSQKLTSALQTANERAWKALEIALAGDSLWERCKVALAAAEDKAFAQQIRLFLDGSPFRSPDHTSVFRDALKELRAARSRSLLTSGQLSYGELAKKADVLARYENPQDVLDAEWKVVEQTAGELREFPNLHRVLVAKTKSGQKPSILVVAVRYYFRREVETNPELARGLTVAKLDAVQDAQEKRFDSLDAALSRQGDRLEKMLADLSGVVVQIAKTTAEIDKTTKEIDKTTKDTHDSVQVLVSQVKTLTEQLQFQNREVRPSDSMSVRSDGERQFVKQLVAKYRSLPEEERQRMPGLLSNLGKLELAAGDFVEAQQKFQTVATMESDPKLQAEAHFNAYQAALQRQDWDGALKSMQQAVALDAARFAPFPAEYEPTRILGAGGFGVAFLCHHKLMDDDVVVKTLQSDELDHDVDRVFNEARALKRLDHPSIVRLSICGFAGAGKKRPYLAMEYFNGMNLESYVEQHGPLSPDDLLAVAYQVAEALKAAHAQGIFHRDVKPGNTLVKREGEGWRVKLIDFGLALRSSIIEGKPSTSGPKAQTTMGKTIAGTLHYAAPEQMGRLPGVEVGTYSDVYGFGRTCYYALFNAPDPDPDDEEELPESWRLLLRKCTRKDVSKRLPDFAAVLAGLTEMRHQPKPSAEVASGSDEHGHDEKHWQENYPAAVECARWYRDLLARFHRDVRAKFAKTMITIYVDGRVRASVRPRRNDRASISVEKLNEGTLAGVVVQLTRAGIAFSEFDGNRLVFEANLKQLKDKQATHEWIAGQLLPLPPSRAGSNDEEAGDEGDETGEAPEDKQWPHQIGDTVTHKGVTGYKIQKFSDDGNGAYIKHPVSGVGKWASFGRLTIDQAQDGDNQESQDAEKDVVVIAARVAWDTYQKYHAWVCQAERSLGQAKYLAFYAQGEIQPVVPEILEKHEKVVLERGKYPGKLGETVDKMLNLASKEADDESWDGGVQKFADGDVRQIVLLTTPGDPRTVKLADSVRNDKKAKSGANTAFTMGQRYVSLVKLRLAKTTTELE